MGVPYVLLFGFHFVYPVYFFISSFMLINSYFVSFESWRPSFKKISSATLSCSLKKTFMHGFSSFRPRMYFRTEGYCFNSLLLGWIASLLIHSSNTVKQLKEYYFQNQNELEQYTLLYSFFFKFDQSLLMDTKSAKCNVLK